MTIKIYKKNIWNIYFYIILFLMLYTSGSIYNFVFYRYNNVLKIIYIVLIFPCLFVLKKKEIQKIVCLICIAYLLFLWGLCSQMFLYNYFTSFLRIVATYIFYMFMSHKHVNALEYIFNIIYAVAIFFLICWLIFDIGPLQNIYNMISVYIKTANGSVGQWNYFNYFNLYYRWHGKRHILGRVFYANNGMFWEPGLYQVYLNFGLWYLLFKKEKINFFKVFMIALAIFSTASTMGMFCMVSLFFIYVICKQNIIGKLAVSLPVLLMAIKICVYVWKEKTIHMAGSISQRLGDLNRMLSLIKKHPILGNGFANYGADNGLLLFIADWGILAWSSLCILLTLVLILKKGGNAYTRIAFLVWLFLSLFNEPITYFSFLWFALFAYLGEGEKEYYYVSEEENKRMIFKGII